MLWGLRLNPYRDVGVIEADSIEPGPTFYDRLKSVLASIYWEDADVNDIRSFIEECDAKGIAIVDMDGME